MKENLQKSPELAYWVGVAQTDGYLKRRKYKKKRCIIFLMSLRVSQKSLPMLHKFREISKKIFEKNVKIHKTKNRNEFEYTIGITKLLGTFQNLDIRFNDPPTPPKWVKNRKFFGPYLAGLIDGDGNIRTKRPEYPQCVIRIGSGSKQIALAESIKKVLNCAVLITPRERNSVLNGRRIHGKYFDLEFYVSPKNFRFIKEHVLPHMALTHKIKKLSSFLREKG